MASVKWDWWRYQREQVDWWLIVIIVVNKNGGRTEPEPRVMWPSDSRSTPPHVVLSIKFVVISLFILIIKHFHILGIMNFNPVTSNKNLCNETKTRRRSNLAVYYICNCTNYVYFCSGCCVPPAFGHVTWCLCACCCAVLSLSIVLLCWWVQCTCYMCCMWKCWWDSLKWPFFFLSSSGNSATFEQSSAQPAVVIVVCVCVTACLCLCRYMWMYLHSAWYK